jgi:REP element-mobilizing transposase RayT
MILNQYGDIAQNEWAKLVERFPNMELDVFQIMPDHMHGIISLNDTPIGARFTLALNNPQPDIQNGQPDIQNPQPDIQNGQPDIQNPQPDIQNPQPDIQNPQPDIQNGQPDIQNGQPDIQNGQPQGIAPTVSDIVGAYKSLVANACLDIYKQKWAGVNPVPKMGKIWQRNYWERIIRDEQSYQNISKYIMNNPSKWNDDKFYKP